MKNGIKVTNEKGIQFWYNEKKQLHRLNNLPAVIHSNGNKEYYVNRKLHRTNGAAIIY